MNDDYRAHLRDEEWDAGRQRRERLHECAVDAQLGKQDNNNVKKKKCDLAEADQEDN